MEVLYRAHARYPCVAFFHYEPLGEEGRRWQRGALIKAIKSGGQELDGVVRVDCGVGS